MNPLQTEYLALLALHGLAPPGRSSPRAAMQNVLDLIREKDSSHGAKPTHTALQARDLLEYLSSTQPDLVNRLTSRTDENPFALHVEAIREVLEANGESVPESIYFDEFPTGEFQARASPTNSGSLCLVNTGLKDFLDGFGFACGFPFTRDAKSIHVHLDPDPEGAFIRGLAHAVTSGYIYLTRRERWALNDSTISYDPFAMMVGASFASAMLTFVLAHEFSHVMSGHLGSSVRQAVGTQVGDLDVLVRSYQEEFEADLGAQRILLLIDRRHPERIPVAVGGACFLVAHLFLLLLKAKLEGREVNEESSDHPRSRDRIDRLTACLSRESEDWRNGGVSRQMFQVPLRFVAALHDANIELDNGSLTFELPPGYHPFAT